MTKQPRDERTQAERRFAELQQGTAGAKDYAEAERQAVRAKTARLREQRLSKEAAETAAAPKKKPARPRKKPQS